MGKYFSQALKPLILSIINGDSGTELVLKEGESYLSGSKWEFLTLYSQLSCRVRFAFLGAKSCLEL